MPKLSQLADSSVAALLSKLGFGSAKQQLLRYVQAGDGTDLSLAYDRAIAAGARTLRIPEGSWTWSTPKDYVSGLKIVGDDEIKSSGVGGTKITAPNGFLKNDNTTRKQIVIKNLHIIGDGTAASVGINGPFGGVISGCKIEGFDDLILNLSGYLVMYKRNAFDDALRGINTADANGTVIEQNWFSDTVGIQITTRDGTPQSGVNSGLPLVIRENNFNATDLTTACLKVRGQLDIRSNYFEKFSGTGSLRFIDLEVNRFDHQGAIIESNEFNGQSAGDVTAIYINGSHAPSLDNPCEGRITCNRIIGCPHDVVYGPNNIIPGLKVYGNYQAVVENTFRGQHLETGGWTYDVLNSDFTTSSGTVVSTGLEFTPEANKRYIVEGFLLVRTATTTVGPRPTVVWPTGMSDGVAYMQAAGAAASTTPRYGNISGSVTPLVTDLPDTTGSWPVKVEITAIAGASPSGALQVGMFSETAGTNITVKAGSWIRWREF